MTLDNYGTHFKVGQVNPKYETRNLFISLMGDV